MNVFSKFADIDQGIITMVLGEIKQATEDTKTAPNKTRGAPDGKASQEKRAKYFSYNQLGTKIVTHIENELKQFYGDIDNAIADEIAFEYGNRVYIVDSTKDNGEIGFGVRKKFYEIDDDNGRKLFIREQNYESISEDRVSDELSQKLRGQDANNRGSDRQQELGEELRIDTGKSSNNQGGIFESIEDRRGVEPSELVKQLRQKVGIEEGKTSRELDTAYLSAVERGDMETAQRMVDEAAYTKNYVVAGYHGTPNGGFTKFGGHKTRNGAKAAGSYWFSEELNHAKVYKSYPQNYPAAENPMVYNVYLDIGNWAYIGNGRVEALDYSIDGKGAATKFKYIGEY